MKKSLITMIVVSFGLAFATANAMKHEAPKADPVAAACKDKKAGTEVTVDGKKTKCPEMKKAEPMKEPMKK